MKTILQYGSATLLGLLLVPATCFARPIHPTGRSRTTAIQSHSPHVSVREAILHHS